MDAATHRTPQTQGGEPLNPEPAIELEWPPGVELDLPRHPECAEVPVAEGYARWAPIYDAAPNPLLAREERYLVPLLRSLPGKAILDLACGTGRWLEKLISHSSAWGVGVDGSEAMLRVARKKSAISGRLANATCERLPFGSAVFDLAICAFALGHIPDLRLVAQELARVTQPGANVFVSDLHPEAYARGWRVGFREQRAAVQIEVLPRSTGEMVETVCSGGFECLTETSLRLGDPEKPIFERAGRAHAFAEACRVPAVLVCQFRRLESVPHCSGSAPVRSQPVCSQPATARS